MTSSRLFVLAVLVTLPLASSTARAACCGNQSKTISSTTLTPPTQPTMTIFKVRTHVQFCGGGASASGFGLHPNPGETKAQTEARALQEKQKIEQDIKTDMLANPTKYKGIARIDVSVHELTVPAQ